MNRVIKKLSSIVLAIIMLVSVMPVLADAPNDDYILKQGDDAYVKKFINSFSNNITLFDYNFVSDWDINTAGGKLGTSSRLIDLQDTSDYLITSATRRFEDITYGKNVNLFFRFSINKTMSNTRIALRNGNKPVVQFVLDGNSLCYIDGSGEYKNVIDLKVGPKYYVKLDFDFDKKIVNRLAVDGKTKLENETLTAPNEAKIDNFYIETGKSTTGTFSLSAIHLQRGYIFNEDFSGGGGNNPDDWNFDVYDVQADSADSGKSPSVTADDFGYLVVRENKNTQRIWKSIEPYNGRFIYEFQLLMPEKRDGIEVNLNSANGPMLTISADATNFCYSAGGKKVQFYDYVKNCWYHFKLDVDTVNKCFDLYLNGKKKAEAVSFDAQTMTGMACLVHPGNGNVWVDNFIMYPYEEVQNLPDYVTEPVKAEKLPEYADIDVGIQICPMWTEGMQAGWEYIERSPHRTPLLGYYDELSAEYHDWAIKWLLEHGVDFMWYTFYKGGTPTTPVQDTFQTQAISNGYFYSKYSEQMPFAIFWENSVGGIWSQDVELNQKNFLEYYAPYLIEHYFLDSRYYKINNRPVIGAYYHWNTFGNFGKDDEFKSFWNDFGKMCEARGLGKPILIHQLSVTEDQYADTLSSFARAGIEGSYPYTLGKVVENDALYRNEYMIKTAGENKSGKIQYLPNVPHGYQVYPWGREYGIGFEPDQYLSLFKDTLTAMEGMDTPLGKRMMILGTWDEFGEGHYLMPTKQYGFGLLDSIKEALCGAGEHEDVVPTAEQIDRFNNYYFAGRTLPIREKYIPVMPEENVYVKKAWNFDTDNEGWKISDNAQASVENGELILKTNGGQINLVNAGVDLSLMNITHAKIRLKSNTTDTTGVLNYTSTVQKVTQPRYEFLFDLISDGEYHDIYLPVGRQADHWKGKLKDLQLELGRSYYQKISEGDEFRIDSIELLATPYEPEENELTIDVDEVTKILNYLSVNDRPLVPLRTVTEMLKGQVFWNGETEEILVKLGGNNVVISDKDNTFKVNNIAEAMPVMESKDGVTYISLDFFGMLLPNKDISWNAESKTVLIKEADVVILERPNDERELLWSTEFNSDGNAEGWGGSWLYGATYLGVYDGCYNFRTGTGNPNLHSPGIHNENIKLESIKAISMRFKTEYEIPTGVCYFTTLADQTWGENKNGTYAAKAADGFQEVTIYAEDFDKERWTDVLYRLRFDFYTGKENNIAIDYIRIYGDFERELSRKEFLDRFDAMTVKDNSISWDFITNNQRDGWKFTKSVADVVCDNGWCSFETLQTDALMETAAILDVNASDVNKISFKYKNGSGGTKAKLYFITDKDKAWNDEKAFDITVTANDNLGNIYEINTADNGKWTDVITGLRFVPSDCAGSFMFDYITLNINK